MWEPTRFGSCWFLWALLLVWVVVLPGQEQPDPWYLISEQELQSIERYREKSEAERQSWLSQVQTLRTKAETLQTESASLNKQLSTAREAQRKSEQLYEQSEAEWLTQISLKNGENAELKQEVATYKGKAEQRLLVIVELVGVIIGYIALRVLRYKSHGFL
jgi:ABC-type phosphate transport system auxiliary subunit